MSKPREFWIRKCDGVMFESLHKEANVFDFIKIEFPAYEKAVEDIAMLKEAIESAREFFIEGKIESMDKCLWFALKKLNYSEGEK